ncbi:hypothetical protein SXIM_47340 [Streptomyces xiamenensis]|uniref:Uncharacterized protein n=2 Tax=Streptomyces TaxID=1883 RepID=A0A0F7FZ61_9ACTN|nr:hypothetical protein SXIM_47340 [Streptomyces xiamenensis]
MMLWARARQLWLLALALPLYALGLVLLNGRRVPLPGLSGSPPATALALFVPLLIVLTLLHCLGKGLHGQERTGVRRTWRYDMALCAAAVAPAAPLGYRLAEWLDFPPLAATGRTLLFLCGLMLLARGLADDRAAGAVPVLWLVLITLVGYSSIGHPYPWTVLLMPPGDEVAWAVSAAVFAAGLALLPRAGRVRSG